MTRAVWTDAGPERGEERRGARTGFGGRGIGPGALALERTGIPDDRQRGEGTVSGDRLVELGSGRVFVDVGELAHPGEGIAPMGEVPRAGLPGVDDAPLHHSLLEGGDDPAGLLDLLEAHPRGAGQVVGEPLDVPGPARGIDHPGEVRFVDQHCLGVAGEAATELGAVGATDVVVGLDRDRIGAADPCRERSDGRAQQVHPRVVPAHHRGRRDRVQHRCTHIAPRTRDVGDAGPESTRGAELRDGEELVGRGGDAELQLAERGVDVEPGRDESPGRGDARRERAPELFGVGAPGVVVARRVDREGTHSGKVGGAATRELGCGVERGAEPDGTSRRRVRTDRVETQSSECIRADATACAEREERVCRSHRPWSCVEHDRCEIEEHRREHPIEGLDVDRRRVAETEEDRGRAPFELGEHERSGARAVVGHLDPLADVPTVASTGGPGPPDERTRAGNPDPIDRDRVVGREEGRDRDAVVGGGHEPPLERRGEGVGPASRPFRRTRSTSCSHWSRVGVGKSPASVIGSSASIMALIVRTAGPRGEKARVEGWPADRPGHPSRPGGVKNGVVEADRRSTSHLGLRARVTAAFAILALVLSVSLALFSYELTRSYLLSRRVATARQQTYLNAQAVRDALRVNPVDVQGALAQAQTGSASAVVLRVGNSWFGTSVGVGRRDVPESLRSLVASGASGTQNTRIAGTPNVTVGVPLPSIGGAYFEFVPVDELELTLTRLAQVLAAAAVVITLLGAVIGRYASGRVLRPVRRMAAAASGISAGGLTERLDADGDSDLEPLVDAFNDMVSALSARIEREARFASDVSHELRTPLAKMSAALSVARRRNSIDSSNAAFDVLDNELQRFTGLVLDLLDISRMEAGVGELDLGEVDPADLVRDVLASTRRGAVPVDVAASAPTSVAVDKRRIGQILTNLFDNADAYGGGVVCVNVSGTTDSLTLAVDDAGPGVPLHEREYVFDRFARGPQRGRHAGNGPRTRARRRARPAPSRRRLGRGCARRRRSVHRPRTEERLVTPRSWLRALVLVVLLTGLAACGVPNQKSASRVDNKRVPFRLLDKNDKDDKPSTPLGKRDAVIYLARGGRLVPTSRHLPPPLTPLRVLRALGRGPTNPEIAAGIRTALPVGGTPRRVRVARGTATVDLPTSFTSLSRGDQVLALAQIVYTVTDQPGIGQVQFTLNRATTDIPRANRSLTNAPVSREDYRALAPPG